MPPKTIRMSNQHTLKSESNPQSYTKDADSDTPQYPWYMINHITIEDRNLLFQATTELLKLLVERVNNEKDNVNLTPMLLKRVWRAALRCVGFTPAQKDDIVCIALLDDATAMTYNIAPFAGYWKILWTIGPKPDCAHDHILVRSTRSASLNLKLTISSTIVPSSVKQLRFSERFYRWQIAQLVV